jgi:hypothetical protein
MDIYNLMLCAVFGTTPFMVVAGKTLPSIVSSLVFQDATSSQHARAPWQPFLPEFQRLIDLFWAKYLQQCNATHKIMNIVMGLWA